MVGAMSSVLICNQRCLQVMQLCMERFTNSTSSPRLHTHTHNSFIIGCPDKGTIRDNIARLAADMGKPVTYGLKGSDLLSWCDSHQEAAYKEYARRKKEEANKHHGETDSALMVWKQQQNAAIDEAIAFGKDIIRDDAGIDSATHQKNMGLWSYYTQYLIRSPSNI